MSKNIIFVTGYFGAPIREIAEKTAEREGCALLSLDEEIEKADGRSILRICMLMGEHEYRNKEYEILSKLPEDDLVVYCGDGVLNDEMSRDIILKHRLVIAGADMSVDELWENAKKQRIPHMPSCISAVKDPGKKRSKIFTRDSVRFTIRSGCDRSGSISCTIHCSRIYDHDLSCGDGS